MPVFKLVFLIFILLSIKSIILVTIKSLLELRKQHIPELAAMSSITETTSEVYKYLRQCLVQNSS
jgi:hypothetical protein